MVRDEIVLVIDGVKFRYEDILSARFNDNNGGVSDSIYITTTPEFTKPAPYAKVKMSFESYKDNNLVASLECGLFYVQSVDRIDAKLLTISATSVEYSSAQTVKHSLHYQNTNLSSILKIVAKRVGCSLNFKTDDIYIASLNQTNESDLNFINRLAQDYNCVFSIKNGYLYFVNKDISLPTYDVDILECESSSIKLSKKSYYNSCKANYYDIDEAKIKSVKYGSTTPEFVLNSSFSSREEALLQAKAKLKTLLKSTKNGYFTTRGFKVYAGAKINIFNTYNKEDDGIYSVVKVEHTYTKHNGWMSYVEFEK